MEIIQKHLMAQVGNDLVHVLALYRQKPIKTEGLSHGLFPRLIKRVRVFQPVNPRLRLLDERIVIPDVFDLIP